MAIVRMSWFNMGNSIIAWVEWDDSDHLIRTVVVRNIIGFPVQYSVTDVVTQALLVQGTVQSQAGDQTFNIPTPQRRDVDAINLNVWW